MHEARGEGLAGLQARGGLGGTYNDPPGGAEAVDDAIGERDFGADNGEIDAERFGQGERIGRATAGRDGGYARIAGSGVEMDASGLGELPGDGVFAAAGTDDENVQGMVLVLILAGRGAGRHAMRVELI